MSVASAGDGEATAWHALAAEEVARRLGVKIDSGLPRGEVERRQAEHGPNAIREGRPRTLLERIASQLGDFMILVLLAAAVVSGLLGDLSDTIAIVVIVALNALIGLVQESRAERALEALKSMSAPHARVLRDGGIERIAAAEIVPGDIVMLEAGDIVPADLRLAEAAGLKADESLLTGESVTVEKCAKAIGDEAAGVAERAGMAFKGTTITYGRGVGLAVATGMATEVGRIAGLLDASERVRTPLQRRLEAFGKRLAVLVMVICTVIFAIGLLRGEAPLLMFLTAVSLAVAAIPEALPAVVTVALALGARRMVVRNALIRSLPAVETLGSITFVCSDKTGTLTENRMRVEELRALGERVLPTAGSAAPEPAATLRTALALCNDAVRAGDGSLVGDPTETALAEAAAGGGLVRETLERDWPRRLELPFDADRKRMTTIHRSGDRIVAYTKGAPETVIPLSIRELTATGEIEIARAERLAEAERMAEEGLRVIAVTRRVWREMPDAADAAAIESELTLVGLVGLMDPPRAEARDAVATCRAAGVTPVMITGDHPATAQAIAHRLGIVEDGGRVLTGRELAELSEAEFARLVGDVRVYARMDPAQKIRIVEALQRNGELVAMTGDGVNDAPALKRADIGVAMGKGGTDVAREAASLVLVDDNFATIVKAIEEGRRIFDNVRKFIKYTMTSNSGEIWTIFLAPFLGLPVPLLPIHILWINLVTDGLPGLALAAEGREPGVMRRPPRPPKESIFAHGMWQHMVWCGLAMGLVSLAAQAGAIASGASHWQTMVFTVLTLSQMGHVLAIRSDRASFFDSRVPRNPMLWGAVALTFVLQMAVIYIPALNPIFHTAPLTDGELAVCLALSTIVFALVEIEKWLARRGLIYRQ
ncbi:MAG: cation-translocating P-type ATPase [Pseudomonadota bacterium]